MRKHRSRRLGGTPAEHAARAERDMEKVAAYARESKAATKLERCGAAFDKLVMANSTLALAKRDIEDSGDFPALEDAVFLPLRGATLAFRGLCLVGGGLSGVRRRRR